MAALAGFATPALSDAMDRLRIPGQVHGVRPLEREYVLAGRAFTVQYQPVDGARGTVGDYIDDVEPGHVVVLDNRGREDATVWGDILTMVASRRGVAGTVIDGVARDVGRSNAFSYPVFARGRWMRTGKDRVQMVGCQVPVTIGSVRVSPGDVLVGDGDGVVVVPRGREGEVLQALADIEGAEERIRQMVAGGARLDEARRQQGYHQLQAPGPVQA